MIGFWNQKQRLHGCLCMCLWASILCKHGWHRAYVLFQSKASVWICRRVWPTYNALQHWHVNWCTTRDLRAMRGNPVSVKWKETRKATIYRRKQHLWVSRSKNFTKLWTDLYTIMSSESHHKCTSDCLIHKLWYTKKVCFSLLHLDISIFVLLTYLSSLKWKILRKPFLPMVIRKHL
jgi:hypothetical protein